MLEQLVVEEFDVQKYDNESGQMVAAAGGDWYRAEDVAARIAELEAALRWHVGVQHDRYCDVQENKPICDCGHNLLRRTS